MIIISSTNKYSLDPARMWVHSVWDRWENFCGLELPSKSTINHVIGKIREKPKITVFLHFSSFRLLLSSSFHPSSVFLLSLLFSGLRPFIFNVPPFPPFLGSSSGRYMSRWALQQHLESNSVNPLQFINMIIIIINVN
jgi:hypothetical protein